MVAPNTAGIIYYGRWNVNSSAAVTINNGSTCEFSYTGNSCVLNFNVSSVINGFYPIIEYWIDEVGPTRATLNSGGSLTITPAFNTLPSGSAPYASVTAAQHRVKFTACIDSLFMESGSNWTNQLQGLTFLGPTLAGGGTILAQPTCPNTIEFLGDSITAGLRVLFTSGSPANGNTTDSPSLSWPMQVAEMLQLKPIVNGHGGQGITTSSTDGTPPANAAFPFMYNGVAWNPTNKPIVVFVYMGTNDSSFTTLQYQTYLSSIRAAYPLAVIIAACPYNKSSLATNIQTAVTNLADSRIFFKDYSAIIASTDTSDGTHPSIGGCVKMAATIGTDTQTILTSAGISMQSNSGSVGNITGTQALTALGVLSRSVQPPFLTQSQTGMYINGANQLVIPQSTYNIGLGNALSNDADGSNIYLGLNIGDPASGD